MVNTSSVVSITTIYLACIAAQPPLSSKAGKISKAWSKTSLSLSISLPSNLPFDEYTEFGAPLLTSVYPSRAPSRLTAGSYVPSKSPSRNMEAEAPAWTSLAPTAIGHSKTGVFDTISGRYTSHELPNMTGEYLDNLLPHDQTDEHNDANKSNDSNTEMAYPTAMIVASTLMIVGALGTVIVLLAGKDNGTLVKVDDVSSTLQRSDMMQVQDNELSGSKSWPNPFVVSEHDELVWRSWGILPVPFVGRLASIREEDSIDGDYFDEGSI